MERARCKVAAAPRNNSAGGAAGWTALRAPESREECEMMHAYACHVCGPVNLTGETRTGINASIAHSPGARLSPRLADRRPGYRSGGSARPAPMHMAVGAIPCQ